MPDPQGAFSLDDTHGLVDSARLGDQRAWAELYQRYRPFLAFVSNQSIPGRLRGRIDADDVVQSAFMNAFQSLHGFEYQGEAGFRRWLRQITVNKLQDRIRHVRAKKRAEESGAVDVPDLDGLIDESSSAETPSRILQRDESRERVLEALGKLDETHQEVVWLRQFEQRSWAEIARIQGCAEVTVRRRFTEALAKLARLVG